jgi:hypothetical protein
VETLKSKDYKKVTRKSPWRQNCGPVFSRHVLRSETGTCPFIHERVLAEVANLAAFGRISDLTDPAARRQVPLRCSHTQKSRYINGSVRMVVLVTPITFTACLSCSAKWPPAGPWAQQVSCPVCTGAVSTRFIWSERATDHSLPHRTEDTRMHGALPPRIYKYLWCGGLRTMEH